MRGVDSLIDPPPRTLVPRTWRARLSVQSDRGQPNFLSTLALSTLTLSTLAPRTRALGPPSGSDLPPQELRAIHALEDARDVRLVRRAARAGMPARRARQARRELRRLARRELRRGLAEVAPRCRLDAVDAGAELHHVEVELEDPPLGERALELPGQDGLADLPDGIARRGEPEVLGELLGDRRGSPRQLALLDGLRHSAARLVDLEPVVGEEIDVLGDEHRALDVGRDGAVWNPAPGHAAVAPGRALRRPVALDERCRPRRARRQLARAWPRPRLVADPCGRGEEQGKQHTPAPATRSPLPARHSRTV